MGLDFSGAFKANSKTANTGPDYKDRAAAAWSSTKAHARDKADKRLGRDGACENCGKSIKSKGYKGRGRSFCSTKCSKAYSA